jgi:hypothetical protein
MKHARKLLHQYMVLIGIVCIGVFLGLFELNNLPAEMWGDAIAHYALANQVLHGLIFFNYRFGGDGPIYTYLVVLVSKFLGLSFYTLKFTSVLVYLLFIVCMYFLTYELFKKKEITYIATFLSTISFWSLTFARQPHARMLVPFFVAATMLFAVKKKTKLSGFLLGLGMYSQASFWAMPFVFWRRYKILLIGLALTIPLVFMFEHGSVGFFTNQSYFGEKLAITDNLSLPQIINNLTSNIASNFFSFINRGDSGFRLNVPNSPHLDFASGVFFFFGFLLLIYQSIKEKKMKYIECIILPIIIIQIPSLLDIHNPNAQPNIGRMIGIIPFVYITTAYGITTTWHKITGIFNDKSAGKTLFYICIAYLLLVITIANVYKYFIVYPYFLPDNNTPFAKIIARTIDEYPQSTTFFVIGSGWGQWGQPEQQAIIDSTTIPHNITFLQVSASTQTLCSTIQTSHHLIVFITNPTDANDSSKINSCGRATHSYLLQQNSFQVASVIEVQSKK